MTKIDDALVGVTRLFLDTSPVIYFVETNPTYVDRVDEIFARIDRLEVEAIASIVTLAECLVHPYAANDMNLADDYMRCLVGGRNTKLHPLQVSTALFAAEIRARNRLSLTDAFQAAATTESGCQAILTNDRVFNRIPGMRVLVLDDLTL
jgi:predicted nucleic acid-binding protein